MFPFQGSEVTIPANTSYTCNMLKSANSFFPANRESTDNHVNKIKEMDKILKLKEYNGKISH